MEEFYSDTDETVNEGEGQTEPVTTTRTKAKPKPNQGDGFVQEMQKGLQRSVRAVN